MLSREALSEPMRTHCSQPGKFGACPSLPSVAAILLGSSHDLRQAVDGRQRRMGELLDGLPHILRELHLHGVLPRLPRVLPALAQGLERGIELIAAGIEAHEFS